MCSFMSWFSEYLHLFLFPVNYNRNCGNKRWKCYLTWIRYCPSSCQGTCLSFFILHIAPWYIYCHIVRSWSRPLKAQLSGLHTFSFSLFDTFWNCWLIGMATVYDWIKSHPRRRSRRWNHICHHSWYAICAYI